MESALAPILIILDVKKNFIQSLFNIEMFILHNIFLMQPLRRITVIIICVEDVM